MLPRRRPLPEEAAARDRTRDGGLEMRDGRETNDVPATRGNRRCRIARDKLYIDTPTATATAGTARDRKKDYPTIVSGITRSPFISQARHKVSLSP